MSIAEMIARHDPTKGAQLTVDETVVLGEYIVHLQAENAELKRKIEELSETHERYEFLRILGVHQMSNLITRCTCLNLRFDDEVLRLARVWQEEKRIDL